MKINWTPTALKTFHCILAYLEEFWTEKEIQNFINEVERCLIEIERNPRLFQESRKKKNIRKGIITKYTSVFYRIRPRKKELELLTFWDNRQDPRKSPY